MKYGSNNGKESGPFLIGEIKYIQCILEYLKVFRIIHIVDRNRALGCKIKKNIVRQIDAGQKWGQKQLLS